ncbi:hypothetical protein [Butyrivibrio sp. NC3005]|uniref:hypothetical protein n=1 Tax=Butyrivibrio sp. NC3005 TaxID=1280685 RepID=UPI0004152068|nr:hypothetical protein [Butyrivibrio sp. NC3005]
MNREDKADKLLDAFGEIDDKFIEEAMNTSPSKKKIRVFSPRTVGVLATLAAAVLAFAYIKGSNNNENCSTSSPNIYSDTGNSLVTEGAEHDEQAEQATDQCYEPAEKADNSQEIKENSEKENAKVLEVPKDINRQGSSHKSNSETESMEESAIPTDTSEIKSDGAESKNKDGKKEETSINAKTTFRTLEEAEKYAGFKISYPEPAENSIEEYLAIKRKKISVFFSDTNGRKLYVIEKSISKAELDEEESKYSYESKEQKNGLTITLKGQDKDNIKVAIWDSEGYKYLFKCYDSDETRATIMEKVEQIK